MTTIQLINSSAVHRRMLRYILQHQGHTVVLATSGVEVLEQLARSAFDLLIINMAPPAMDGLTILKHVRAHYADRRLPILITTESGREADYNRAFEAGASAVLPWPFSAAELSAVVQILVGDPLPATSPMQLSLSTVRFAAFEAKPALPAYQQAS